MNKITLSVGICGFILAFSLPIAAQTSTFTDPRDGQKYRTVKIGKQTWMAENLNYKISNSLCYENNEANCQKYGRLYDWNTAMKACPAEWRLPTENDWSNLIKTVGGSKIAGKKLKSKTGWSDDGNGTDDYGFSALPGGEYGPNGPNSSRFSSIGIFGYWWGTEEEEDGGDNSFVVKMRSDDAPNPDHGGTVDGVSGYGSRGKRYQQSVRCVQK